MCPVRCSPRCEIFLCLLVCLAARISTARLRFWLRLFHRRSDPIFCACSFSTAAPWSRESSAAAESFSFLPPVALFVGVARFQSWCCSSSWFPRQAFVFPVLLCLRMAGRSRFRPPPAQSLRFSLRAQGAPPTLHSPDLFLLGQVSCVEFRSRAGLRVLPESPVRRSVSLLRFDRFWFTIFVAWFVFSLPVGFCASCPAAESGFVFVCFPVAAQVFGSFSPRS
jgi:hypothetical protein